MNKPYAPTHKPMYESTMRHLDLPSNSTIDTACRFLEREGYRFCIDFGLNNAESLMWQLGDEQWGLQ